jgi:hypothetical protein
MRGPQDSSIPVGHHDVVAISETIRARTITKTYGYLAFKQETTMAPFSPFSSSSRRRNERGSTALMICSFLSM